MWSKCGLFFCILVSLQTKVVQTKKTRKQIDKLWDKKTNRQVRLRKTKRAERGKLRHTHQSPDQWQGQTCGAPRVSAATDKHPPGVCLGKTSPITMGMTLITWIRGPCSSQRRPHPSTLVKRPHHTLWPYRQHPHSGITTGRTCSASEMDGRRTLIDLKERGTEGDPKRISERLKETNRSALREM